MYIKFKNENIQKVITEWQEEKQDVMKTLKHNLHAIDDASYSLLEKAGAQTVTYNNENGMYNVRTSDGATVPITLGALMTDGTWGISCKLDKSVPRQVRKEYLVKEARSKLSELYDRQIIKHEGYRINDNEERGDYDAVGALYHVGHEGVDEHEGDRPERERSSLRSPASGS